MKNIDKLKTELVDSLDEIREFLESTNQDGLSFDINAPPVLAFPGRYQDARDKAIEAMDELTALLRGPVYHMMNTVIMQIFSHGAFHSIGRFRIAEKIGKDEEVSFDDLATRCNIAPDNMIRLMRVAITYRIFQETKPGFVSHNAVSWALVEQPMWSAFITHGYEDIIPAQLRAADAFEKWPKTEDPTENAFALANNITGATAFEIMAKDPGRARRFADSMVIFQANPTIAISHISDNFDWHGKKDVKIVDVGGSHGSLCTALLRDNPDATAIVQDLPEVVVDAEVPKDLDGRLTFQVQNFLEVQQEHGADAYIFRMIFHDWPDTTVTRILKNHVPAMKHGTRVIICDRVLPEPGTLRTVADREIRGNDLGMKVTFNGKERDISEWRNVLARADPRYHLQGFKTPPGSQLSIIEVVWQ